MDFRLTRFNLWMGTLLVILFYGCSQNEKQVHTPISNVVVDTLESIPESNPPPISKITYDYDTSEWTEIIEDQFYEIDIRYATPNNFMKQQIYDCPRCFVKPHMASALQIVAEQAAKKNYKLVMYDCYRPKRYQQKLWDIKPDARYVTKPSKGSMHNRGVAVDVGLVQKDGSLLDMGTEYDYFGRKAYPGNQDVDSMVYQNRQYLKGIMESQGLMGIRTEWWHFSIKKNAPPISDWLWNCE